MYIFNTKGTCASEIKIKVNDNKIIEKIEFVGGCNGNLAGLSSLVEGEKVDKIIKKLAGIRCKNGTSCPDQLSKALKELKNQLIY
ncbi:TIGR03905 family TSCPD domain-containing protein [Natronospora cellulosivora (SeqCode)]